MKTFRWLALVGVSALAGCAVSRPPSTVPATSPAGWHAPLPHEGRLADLQRWWLQLDDPLLPGVLGHRDVRVLAHGATFSRSQVMTAFWACRRFSAWSQMTLAGPSSTAAVISLPR